MILFGLLAWHGVTMWQAAEQTYPNERLNEFIATPGIVASIPEGGQDYVRFKFDTPHGRLQLTAFDNDQFDIHQISPGQQWTFKVRVRQPQGFNNPYNFNYAQWLQQQRIIGAGLVSRYSKAQFDGYDNHFYYLVQHYRYVLKQFLQKQISDSTAQGVALALLIGDRSNIDKPLMQRFQQTGTAHLIAISGMHIGLISAFVFGLVRFLWSCFPRLCIWQPAQRVATFFAISAAGIYAALAGFSIPTQRAFLMVLVVAICWFGHHRMARRKILFWVALIVALWNPLALWQVSFWLSFSAVAFLLYITTILQSVRSKWRLWLYPQIFLSTALIPVTVFWFGGFSWVSVPANLFAIPLVSLFIVPGLFITAFMSLLTGAWIWWPIVQLIQGLVSGLSWFDHLTPFITWHQIHWLVMLGAIIGILILFAPLRWHHKMAGFVLCLPLWQPPTLGDDQIGRITILDVGQGSGVVVQVKDYVLVYDTADAFNRQTAVADLTIVPFLQAQGIYHIDTLVVSHAHQDHSGGVKAILEQMPVKQVISNRDQVGDTSSETCDVANSWQIGSVNFMFMNDPTWFLPQQVALDDIDSGDENNASCVLAIQYQGHQILLTGDIERQAERYLLDYHYHQLDSDVLLAPHHGSHSSSTLPFIQAVDPMVVVYSAGAHNRYDHPHQKIVKRYQKAGVTGYNTAKTGAVTIWLTSSGDFNIETMESN